MTNKIEYILSAIRAQRNSAMDALAAALSEIEHLKVRVAELEDGLENKAK